MNDQAIRFRIGIFVLGAFILLAVLIILFGGFPTMFKPAETYTVRFTNVAGVSQGTPVRRAGVRIGEVRQLSLDDEAGRVNVLFQIEKGYTIRKNDQVILGKGLFGTDVSIDFVPQVPEPGKVADTTLVEPGAVLEGVMPADVVQRTAELVPPAQEMINDFRKVLQRLDKMGPLLEDTLREYRDVGKGIREAMPELKRTSSDVSETAKITRQVMPELRKTFEEFQVTARTWSKVGERADVLMSTNEEKITKAIDRLQDTLKRFSDVFSDENQKNFQLILKNTRATSDRFEQITKTTEGMLVETQKTIKRINESVSRTEEILTNLQKATKPIGERSQSIVKNLDESTGKLNLLLGDVRGLLNSFGKADGTVQRFLSDPTLFHSLTETMDGVNKMMPRLQHILRDVEIFADKIARHPESLGVGGALRPSNGLKEGPTIFPWRGHFPPP